MNKMFKEKIINTSKIKNRIVMAPMVCFGYAKEDGLVTDKNIEHYRKRAKGGVGLIIVEATCVNVNGRLDKSQLGIWSDNHINGLKQLVNACHEFDAKVIIQIHHAGLKTPVNISLNRVSSSDYSEGDISARTLSLEELKSLQGDYIEAAVRAKKAGFEGIELHGAHGYLLSQFFSPLINKRLDSYGGNIENRTRFATEIIHGIRQKLGKEFIIAVRMGGNEPDLEQGVEIAKELEKAGADILHVSWGMFPEKGSKMPNDFKYHSVVYNAIQIKKAVKIPIIAVNGIKTREKAGFLLENDLIDFIAVGRGLLIEPEWANKANKEMDIKTCLECRNCKWFSSAGELCPQIK